MNKSKFLKRSLAAILAILMVVAMVPSALAAQVVNESVPTARVFNDPGYLISVGGDRAVWDADNGAYKVSTTFNEGNGVPATFAASMIEVDRNTVTVKETSQVLKATVENLDSSKATQSVDSFGVGTYTYTLVAVVTDADGDTISTEEYKLIIDLTMKTKSSDATIKAVKSVKLPYAVSAKYDNAKNTIDIVMALGQKTTHDTNLTSLASGVNAEDIFVPSEDTSTVSYANKVLTVTAENGDVKKYAVSFTEEAAFDTFKLGDFEGKALATDAKKIVVDLPYSYYDGSSTVTTTELDDMIAAWTVSTGSKVYFNTTEKESGKEKLTFTADSDTDVIGSEGKYVAVKSNDTIKVQTKKSGAPVNVQVSFRVPTENPDAELTGIQIIKGNGDINDPGATDYTQYIAVNKGSRNITINLPSTIKKTDTDLYIHVWGAKNSKIELAEGRTASNAFETADENGLELTTDKSSDTAINVSKAITLKVVSEDTKTTLLYNVTVNDFTGGSAALTSLKVVDDDGKEVGTVSSLSNKDITITLPYKYGTGTPDPAGLTVIATASNSAKVGYTEGEATEGATEDVAATAASCTYDASGESPLGSDGNLTICGISGAVTNTATDTTIESQLVQWATAANDANWSVSVSGTTVTFTAKSEGKVGESGPASWPTGVVDGNKTDGTEAVSAGDGASDWTAFVKEATVEEMADPSQNGITLPLASDPTDASGSQNIFTLRVNNGSANGSNLYKVTLKKADPSEAATISSVKVTDSSSRISTMTEYGSTVNTRTGQSTSTVKVNELPYSLNATASMYFSELKVSDEAHVVIGTTEVTLPTDSTVSGAIDVKALSSDDNWSKTGKEIKLLVYSEKDWYTTLSETASSATADNATKVYKMSASYAAAGTGSDLTSIASTLNDTIKVATASKTITITVPNSYLDNADKKFSLDIKTSPFAKVFGNAVTGGTSVAITPDEGKADTSGKTEFIVKTDTGDNDTIKLYKDSTAITKLIVQSESETNTSDYNVVVKVAPVETSNAIESITVAGKTATKGADGETWNLVLPVDADLVQLVDIKTASKLAAVEVDGVSYDAENYYDLGDDLSIKVTAENGDAFTYTLKTVREGITTNTDIADIRAGAYNATKGTGNAWTIQVPEGTDMSNPSLTVRTVVDGAKVTSVNGEAYTDGMTVDLSEGKTLTIVITAADGITTGTHTVTAQFGNAQPSEQYHDIPAGGMGDWVTKAINYGLMSNTGSNAEGKLTFDPNAKVERKYFALMVARADVMAKDATITDKDAADAKLKSLYSGTPAFSDAPANDETVNAALEYCKINGIISGYEDGTFKPNSYVSRTEAASIMVGWLDLEDAGTENTNNFKDWTAIGWAHGKVNSVVKAGVMSGIGGGNFGTGTLIRQDTAVILTRAFENLRDSK